MAFIRRFRRPVLARRPRALPFRIPGLNRGVRVMRRRFPMRRSIAYARTVRR